MRPVLFEWGSVVIPSFGFFLGLGFVVGSFVLWRLLKEEIDEEELVTFSLVLGLSGLIGARLLFVLFQFGAFGWKVEEWLSLVSRPGLSIMGAILGIVAGTTAFTTARKWRFWDVWDSVLTAGLWTAGFAGIGAFLSGSMAGLMTSRPWGIITALDITGKRHPVSLYLVLVIVFLLWWVGKINKVYRKFRFYPSGKVGFVGLSGMALLSLLFFILEYFMERKIYFVGVSLSQAGYLFLFSVSIFLIYALSGRKFSIDIKDISEFFRRKGVFYKQKARNLIRKK